MRRIKTLLILSLVIALSFSLFGCKLLPWGDSAVEETTTIAALPGWLTLAHRAEAAEESKVDEEEATEEEATEEEATEEEEETAEAPAQPATTQPATTQPAQTVQPAQSSSTPKYLQPGTMEYIAKMRLDEMVTEYRRLKNRNKNDLSESDKSRLAELSRDIPKVAAGLGIDLKQYYGIDTAGADSSLSSGAWFHDMDSPTGWGN